MELKSSESIGNTFTQFIDDVGIPSRLVVMVLDPAQSGKHTLMQQTAQCHSVHVYFMEKGHSEQSHTAEGEIGQVKCRWKHRMTS